MYDSYRNLCMAHYFIDLRKSAHILIIVNIIIIIAMIIVIIIIPIIIKTIPDIFSVDTLLVSSPAYGMAVPKYRQQLLAETLEFTTLFMSLWLQYKPWLPIIYHEETGADVCVQSYMFYEQKVLQ